MGEFFLGSLEAGACPAIERMDLWERRKQSEKVSKDSRPLHDSRPVNHLSSQLTRFSRKRESAAQAVKNMATTIMIIFTAKFEVAEKAKIQPLEEEGEY